jgi:hypothetical protein
MAFQNFGWLCESSTGYLSFCIAHIHNYVVKRQVAYTQYNFFRITHVNLLNSYCDSSLCDMCLSTCYSIKYSVTLLFVSKYSESYTSKQVFMHDTHVNSKRLQHKFQVSSM